MFVLQQPGQGSARLQKLNGLATKVKTILVTALLQSWSSGLDPIDKCRSAARLTPLPHSDLAPAQSHPVAPSQAHPLEGRRDGRQTPKLPSLAVPLFEANQEMEATLLTNTSPLTSSEPAAGKTRPAIQQKRLLPATLQRPPLILLQLSGSQPTVTN